MNDVPEPISAYLGREATMQGSMREKKGERQISDTIRTSNHRSKQKMWVDDKNRFCRLSFPPSLMRSVGHFAL